MKAAVALLAACYLAACCEAGHIIPWLTISKSIFIKPYVPLLPLKKRARSRPFESSVSKEVVRAAEYGKKVNKGT